MNINYNTLIIKSNTDKKIEELNIANNPNFNIGLLDDIIQNGKMENYSNEYIFKLLSNNLEYFLSKIVDHKDKKYLDAVISERFLDILIQIVSSKNLDNTIVTYLNNICYDYISLDDVSTSDTRYNMIIQLAKTVNKKYVPILIGANIPEKIAIYIVLARFSSQSEEDNIRRMNFVILNANINFTEQMIVDIYQNLFTKVSQLFEVTMMTIYDDDDVSERDSLITLAILDILNSLPSNSIRKVLEEYRTIYLYKYNGYPTRFNLRALSSDYERIRVIVESMYNEGITLP